MPIFDLKTLFQRSDQPKVPPFPTLDLSNVKTGADILTAVAEFKVKIEERRVAREGEGG
jgi:hypothetical protein